MAHDNKTPFMQVLNSSVMLTRLMACSFCWLTNTFVYYGLSLNSVAFAGDKYTNFILVALVEIPAYFLTWFLTDYIGRKATLSSSFLLSGAFCLAIQFVPSGKLIFIRETIQSGGRYSRCFFQVRWVSCHWFCTWEANGASRCPSPPYTFTRPSCSPRIWDTRCSESAAWLAAWGQYCRPKLPFWWVKRRNNANRRDSQTTT